MQRLIECDPLSFSGWMTSASASQWLGDYETAIETARRGFEITGHRLMMWELSEALIGAGRYEEATALIESEFRAEAPRLGRLLRVAAAQGEQQEAQRLLGEFLTVSDRPDGRLMALAVAGDRQRANEIAAELDATRFGYLVLMRSVHSCHCGAPFDLEVTPNYAQLIEDGNLAWPPASPTNWPLKDW
jgi:tetratricopeptide (TPR) repeat protein